MIDRIPALHEMTRALATDADTVVTYRMADGPQEGMTVVEAMDAHRRVIARTITSAAGTREDVADLTLAGTLIERCATWGVDPIGNNKRSAAMVILSTTATRGTLDAMRAAHGATA